jgi:hypothetical protein
MEKMSSTSASGVLFLGILVLLGLSAFALWGPISAPTAPKKNAKAFFSASQYTTLFGKSSKFDPQHPGTFALSTSQTSDLNTWGYAGCVQNDGTKDESGSGCFCENAPAVRAIFSGSSVIQPQNTWSAFLMGWFGVLILAIVVFSDVQAEKNFMTASYFFPLCYAVMTILLGPLSMMLHAGLRKWGGFGDDLSLYLWFGFTACYGIVKIFNRSNMKSSADGNWSPSVVYSLFGAGWLLAVIVPAILTAPFKTGGKSIMASTWWYLILGGIALICEGILAVINLASDSPDKAFETHWAEPSADHWYSNLGFSDLFSGNFNTGGITWFVGAFLIFGVAITVWILSYSEYPACFPQGPQGHALFHTLSAVAAVFLFMYYRREGESQ